MMTRSLSKVFISIKGYYYQADIMGHKVTWIVAHPNPHAVSKIYFNKEIVFRQSLFNVWFSTKL